MKIDLHVHSGHSTRPSQWILQKIGCPESFTKPQFIYDRARELGMDLVTITDHNTIDGALSIAHLPGAFVSVEITTYFPEDGCKAHVLALNIDEETFAEIQKIRENIYDLAAFLKREKVIHVSAHPLYGVNGKLTPEHVGKLLLLFSHFELNGAREGAANSALERITANLTPEIIERLANRHGIEPAAGEPWKKHLTGGSDDHSGLHIARRHTEAPFTASLPEFLEALAAGRILPRGRDAKPENMAHTLYSIGYQFYDSKLSLGKYAGKDVCINFLDNALRPGLPREQTMLGRVQTYFSAKRYGRRCDAADSGKSRVNEPKEMIFREAARIILGDPDLRRVSLGERSASQGRSKDWFRFVSQATNRVLSVFAGQFFDNVSGLNVFDIFKTIGSAGALYTVTAPFFAAYSMFNEDRIAAVGIENYILGGAAKPTGNIAVAHFTDTLGEVNGVARTLRNSQDTAMRLGKKMSLLACDPDLPEGEPGIRNFTPIGVFELPEYPEQKIFYPPLLDIIRHVFECKYTHIHSSTPGPMGLAALLASRILKLPIHGTYHTQIPQYAKQLTGDDQMEELVWKYTIWYYNQMDTVFAPSQATADELAAKGVSRDKITVYPRGVDTALYHPSKKNGFLKSRGVFDGVNLLYAGRLSKEKNLDMLVDAFKLLSRKDDRFNLILAGDGPMVGDLKKSLHGERAVFTGFLSCDELANCYSSCDLFVFPSLTDTFGNVVMEAQASGLPVIVGNAGGPRENVIHGETGLVLDSVDPLVWANTIGDLLSDDGRLKNMGRAARAMMENRTFEDAFKRTWELYEAARL
ncbi:MAG: glycosyltransferase [Desulfovibrionaceae bacterium]|nr:glycosyltransferase [Desulfovibrionaceae bacterium]MBF0513747.1 glycosyltransferase [Desulfovibrionaceae bacterium]